MNCLSSWKCVGLSIVMHFRFMCYIEFVTLGWFWSCSFLADVILWSTKVTRWFSDKFNLLCLGISLVVVVVYFTVSPSLCYGVEYSSSCLSDDSFFFLHEFVSAVDIISAIEFDKSGDHLATGDRGGRVVLFERTDTKDVRPFFFCEIYFNRLFLCCNAFLFNVIFRMVDPGGMLSRWITQLGILSFDTKQSFRVMNLRYVERYHQISLTNKCDASATKKITSLSNLFQFDYLKSLEIEEKINKIRWCQPANGALFLLSTNDKTIKYWKVRDLDGLLSCFQLL